MKRNITYVLAILFAVFGFADTAHATTLGDTIVGGVSSVEELPWLASAFSYVLGMMLCVWSILSFKEHVDGGPRAPSLFMCIRRMLAGGLFLSLPYALETVQLSLFAGAAPTMAIDGASAAPVAAPTTVDEMAVRFIADLTEPMGYAVSAFAYMGGIILVIMALSRLLNTYDQGWKGPSGIGTIMCLFCGGALISAGPMMAAFSISIFGDATSNTNPVFSGELKKALGAQEDRARALLEALVAFVIIVGWIAFVRGLFVLKSVADGNQQVSMAQALTFLISGAIAINIGEFVNIIQETAAGTAVLGLTFS